MIFAGVLCDVCGKSIDWEHIGKVHVVSFARRRGWSIGVSDKCPDCRNSKKKPDWDDVIKQAGAKL